MANIDGICAYNSPNNTNKLFAVYGNDIVDTSTGLGAGLNLTAGNKASFEVFIDTIFFTNGVDKMRSYVGGSWSDSFALPKQLVPKYVRKSINNSQMLAANCILTPGTYTPLNYKSYVFKSNFPKFGKNPAGTAITQTMEWGLESGLCTIDQLSRKVRAVPDANGRLPYFKTRGIKVGDPFFLNQGDVGQYTVQAIPSEYELILNETIPSSTNTNVSFWVGSNWFQVGIDDNDQIMGLGENNGRDLIFKLFSMWYYTGTQLKQVKGAPGTNSHRSIINDKQGNTFYFYGADLERTGIYMYNGVQSVKASRAIDPFLAGMSASNYSEVVAWAEGDELRFFLGNLTNNPEGISMTNAVASYNTVTGAWDVSPIKDVIKCATNYIVNNVQNAYTGTDSARILKMNVGNDFNGVPIPCVLETGIKYPSGSEIECSYPWVQVIGKNVRGLKLLFKRWDQPTSVDDSWIPLGELKGDKTEYEFPIDKRVSAGIQFRFEEDGKLNNDWLVEKLSLFYKPDRTRLL